MASYYYLISSLPMLRADSAMPFSYDTFLSMCQTCVDASTYKLLENLSVNSTEGPLVEDWAKFYGVLASELSYQRNLKLGRPCDQPVEREEETIRAVSAALNAQNPLEAEIQLLELEFKKLDELTSLHFFDAYTLFGYALKLKLLQRLTIFDTPKGQTEFKRLFDGIQAQILSI